MHAAELVGGGALMHAAELVGGGVLMHAAELVGGGVLMNAHESLASPQPVGASARACPEHVALIAADRTVTYGELCADVALRAAFLRANGVERGSVVALHGRATIDWVAWFFAIVWAGGAVAPMAPRATPRERTATLRATAASFDLAADEGTLAVADRDAHRLSERAVSFASCAGLLTPMAETWLAPSDVVLLVTTSGTTAAPRTIPLRAGQLFASAFGSMLRLGHLPSDRWLCCLPLEHIAGASILWRAALGGTTVLLTEKFEPRRVAEQLDRGEANLVSLTPEMLTRVLAARVHQPFPASVRAILVGGAPATEALLERCRTIRAPVALSWGMSEAASQIATRTPGDLAPLAEHGSGAPLALTRVTTEHGRLVVDGAVVNGRLVTDDLGAVDGAGRVHVHGRVNSLINSGGKKIDPAEVEAALREHPAVLDAAVCACDSARFGERPAAALVLAVGHEQPTDDALRAHCRRALSGYKIPAFFRWIPELPRTALGKLARAEIARLLDDAEIAEPILRVLLDAEIAEPILCVLVDAEIAAPVAQQTKTLEPTDEDVRRDARPEVAGVHEGLNKLSACAQVGGPERSTQGEAPRDRAPAEPLDAELHCEPLAEANGRNEIRFGAHDGHRDVFGGEQVSDPAVEREQELLESLVAKLEHSAEKQDPGAIDLKEARSDAMNERHDVDRR